MKGVRKLKKYLIILVCLVCALSLFACSNDSKADPTVKPDATATPTESTDETPTPEVTEEPTPEPTKEPQATVEPGKETYAGKILDADNGLAVNFSPQTGSIKDEAIIMNAAVQFFATTTFNQIDINSVSYGNDIGTLIFKLYSWQGSYFSTLESEPIATMEFVDFPDNTISKFTFDQELPDGEYLLEITTEDPSEGVGVYTNIDAEDLKTRFYKNDEVVEKTGIYMTMHYTKTPEKVAGPLQDPGF